MDIDEESLEGQVGDMMGDIESDESGESDMPDMDSDDDSDIEDEGMELDSEEGDDDLEAGIELDSEEGDDDVETRVDDLEDRVVSAEERLDRLMAEFEKDLGGEEGEELEADGEDLEAAGADDVEAGEEEEEAGEEEEEAGEEEKDVMESLSLVPVKKVSNPSVQSHGPARTKPGIAAKGSPVNFSQGGSSTRGTPSVKPGKQYGNTGLGHKVGLSSAPAAQKKPMAGSGSKSPIGGKK
jgi:hypothetical protein